MALTPQNSEAFLREVDEELRRDQAVRLWKRWGKAALVAIVLALLALAGWLWWKSDRAAKAGVEGESLSTAIADLAEGKDASAVAKLTPIAQSKVDGYRVAAQLALADVKLGKDDTKGAAAGYAAVANDTRLAQPYRNLATIREVAARYDSMKPEEIVARLRPLAVAGNPWFGSAGEMTAIAYLRMNRSAVAGQMLAALAKDETVPETVRSRSVQLAGVLGVDTGGIAPATARGRN